MEFVIYKTNRRAFTLLEMMIVIGIIIIISAIAIPSYLNVINRNKIASAKQTINVISSALEEYRIEWGMYPHDKSKTLTIESFGCDQYDSSIMEKELTGNGVLNSSTKHNKTTDGYCSPIKYINKESFDGIKNPWIPSRHYIYASNGTSYVIYIKMQKGHYLYTETNGQTGVMILIKTVNSLNDIPNPFANPLIDPEDN